MINNLQIVGIFCLLVLSSCAGHRPITQKLDTTNGSYHISYDATRRGNFITLAEGKVITSLAEVQPDVALANALELTSKLKQGEKLDAEQMTKITESLTVLGERTAAVNILRDALFRLEEHCLNSKGNCGNEYWYRFDAILEAVKEMQIADKAKSEVKIQEMKNSIK